MYKTVKEKRAVERICKAQEEMIKALRDYDEALADQRSRLNFLDIKGNRLLEDAIRNFLTCGIGELIKHAMRERST